MDIKTIIDALNTGGVIGILGLIIVGGMRQWWIWGWLYKQQREELEEWRRLALKGTSLANEATIEAEHRVPAPKGRFV